MIAVSGDISKSFYESKSGERKIAYGIVADDIHGAAASLQPQEDRPRADEIDDKLKAAMAERAEDLMPERLKPDGDSPPELD